MTQTDRNNIGAKLAKLRKASKLSQNDVARHISLRCQPITNRAVSKWENGDSQPDAEQFINLCHLYGVTDVTAEFLGIDAGSPFEGLNKLGRERALEYIEMLKESAQFSGQVKPVRFKRQLPLYDLPASAGTGVFLDSDNYTMIEVDESVPDSANIAVRISGDSMEPLFRNGQIVYVHQQPTLENGDIGIFVLNGEAYCKRLDTENGVKLVSLNRKYQPIKIKYAYELHAVGKVVG